MMGGPLLPVVILAVLAIALLLFYRPTTVLIIFGLAAPVGLVDLPGGIAVSIAMSFLIAFAAMFDRLQRGLLPLPRDLPALAAVVWIAGIIVSTVLSADLFMSANFGAWQVASALLAVGWAELAGRLSTLRPALVAWLIGAVAVAGSGLVISSGGLQADYGGAVVTGRPTGIFAQPNEYGLYCMVVLIFTLGLMVLTTGWVRWLSVAVAGISGVGLLLSLSRGAWLGAVAGVVLLAVLIPQFRRPLALGGAVAVVMAAVLTLSPAKIPVVNVVLARALSIGDKGSNPYDERVNLRAEGVREWAAAPLFGQGPNAYPTLSEQVTSLAAPSGGEHPHNFVIAVGAEQGFVGVIAIVLFGVSVVLASMAARPKVVAAHRLRRSEGAAAGEWARPELAAAVVIAGAAVLGAFIIEGFADYPLRNPLSRTTVWLMLGWTLAGYRVLQRSPRPPSPRQPHDATGSTAPTLDAVT